MTKDPAAPGGGEILNNYRPNNPNATNKNTKKYNNRSANNSSTGPGNKRENSSHGHSLSVNANHTRTPEKISQNHLPKPSQDQLNVSKMLDGLGNSSIPDEKIQTVMEVTGCKKDAASTALHDSNLDVQGAIDYLLEHESADEWVTTERKKKNKTKKQEVAQVDPITPNITDRDQKPKRDHSSRSNRDITERDKHQSTDRYNNRNIDMNESDNIKGDNDNFRSSRGRRNRDRPGGDRGTYRGRGGRRGGNRNYDRDQNGYNDDKSQRETPVESWEASEWKDPSGASPEKPQYNKPSYSNTNRYTNNYSQRDGSRENNYSRNYQGSRGRGRGGRGDRDSGDRRNYDRSDNYGNTRGNYRGSNRRDPGHDRRGDRSQSDRRRGDYQNNSNDYRSKNNDDDRNDNWNDTETGTWSNSDQQTNKQNDEWKQSWGGTGNWNDDEANQAAKAEKIPDNRSNAQGQWSAGKPGTWSNAAKLEETPKHEKRNVPSQKKNDFAFNKLAKAISQNVIPAAVLPTTGPEQDTDEKIASQDLEEVVSKSQRSELERPPPGFNNDTAIANFLNSSDDNNDVTGSTYVQSSGNQINSSQIQQHMVQQVPSNTQYQSQTRNSSGTGIHNSSAVPVQQPTMVQLNSSDNNNYFTFGTVPNYNRPPSNPNQGLIMPSNDRRQANTVNSMSFGPSNIFSGLVNQQKVSDDKPSPVTVQQSSSPNTNPIVSSHTASYQPNIVTSLANSMNTINLQNNTSSPHQAQAVANQILSNSNNASSSSNSRPTSRNAAPVVSQQPMTTIAMPQQQQQHTFPANPQQQQQQAAFSSNYDNRAVTQGLFPMDRKVDGVSGGQKQTLPQQTATPPQQHFMQPFAAYNFPAAYSSPFAQNNLAHQFGYSAHVTPFYNQSHTSHQRWSQPAVTPPTNHPLHNSTAQQVQNQNQLKQIFSQNRSDLGQPRGQQQGNSVSQHQQQAIHHAAHHAALAAAQSTVGSASYITHSPQYANQPQTQQTHLANPYRDLTNQMAKPIYQNQ